MNDDFGMLDYEMWLDSFDDKPEEPMNEAIDRITQEVHDRSKVLRNVGYPTIHYLIEFYAMDTGLKKSKIDPIDCAEYFDDYESTGAILLDLWWEASLNKECAKDLALADPKFVDLMVKYGKEMYFDKKDIENHGRLFNLIFIGEGKTKYDELERDEIFDDFKRMYYGIKEEFNIAELDKFATDDSYDDPFNVDFDCESGECEKEPEQELGKKVPEIADFSGSVELGHEPETAVNVSRSSSSFGGRKESIVDINVQCEDDEESITDALKELICSLGLEDEFDVDSCCDGEKCPEEQASEPAVEPEEQVAEPEEVKDLSDEDEVKVKMPAEVADDVKDGDMLVVKVDNKDEEEKEGNLDEGFLGIKSADEKNGDILEKAGAKCYIIRTSPRSGDSSQKAKDPANPDKEIQDRKEIRWTDAIKYAKQHSKGSVVIYVKASKDNQTQPDYTKADNFGKSGYLFVDGRMTAQSEQKLKNFLVDLKNTDATSAGNEEKEQNQKVEAEKFAEPAVEKSEEQKSAEPETKEPEASKPALSSENEKDIVDKIKAKYPKTGASLISMLKKAGVLTEEVESAEEDDMSEEEFLEELGKELKNSRECKEAWNAHDNFINPGVIDESPELEGTDNAVKKCKPYKLVAHCEEENIDCEMKKPALEKPLLEDINNIFDLFEAKDMKDDELPVDPEAAKLEVHTMLNDLVADEIEAINGYDDAKAEIMDTPIEHKDNILDTIDHIKEEEQEHIDELIGATTEIPFEKEESHEEEYAVKSLAEALNEDKLQAMEKYLMSNKVAYLTAEWVDEGEHYTDEVSAYLNYKNNKFALAISRYHASEDNNAEYPEQHTDEEEFSFESLADMYEDKECKEILDRLYEDNLDELAKSLAEETHAKYAKPEGDRVAAYNNALKYAKKENKPFIYGYTQMGDGKFFALEQPIKISSSPAEAEKEFKNKYKRCSTVYTVYPDKEFVDESLEEEKINIDYVVSLFGDDSHYYKEDDVKLSPDIAGATKFNKKKDISILDIVIDICEYESKYMPEDEVASLFDLNTLEEVYEKDEDYFINSGLVKIITVYKNKKISLPESLKEDTVIDDFPEPEGEPLSDKEIEEAMGIKEPEEK